MIVVLLVACAEVPPALPPPGAPLVDPGFVVQGDVGAFDLGDVTGDGLPDLVSLADGLVVFAGPIAGARDLDDADALVRFDETGPAVSSPPTVVGDLDGNGAQDLALPVHTGNVSLGGILRGGTTLVWGPLDGTMDLAAAAASRSTTLRRRSAMLAHARVGDLDGDGVDEIAVSYPADRGGGRVLLLEPDGEATRAWTQGPDTNLGMELVSAGDLDGDGTIDLLASMPERSVVHALFTGGWSRGTSLETLGPSILVPGEGAHAMILAGGGDVDGDGANDVIVGSRTRVGTVCVVTALPRSGVMDASAGVCWRSGETPTGAAFVRDLDGDGLDEVVLATSDVLRVFTGDTIVDGVELEDAAFQLNGDIGEVKVADLTGDGVDDLVVEEWASARQIRVIPGDTLLPERDGADLSDPDKASARGVVACHRSRRRSA